MFSRLMGAALCLLAGTAPALAQDLPLGPRSDVRRIVLNGNPVSGRCRASVGQVSAGNAIAEVSVFRLRDAGRAVAAGVFVTPKETLLSKGLTMEVDGKDALKYDFSFCNDTGCYARVGFSEETLSQLKRGNRATVAMYPATAPDTKVTLTLSLRGFTKAVNESLVVD